MIFVLFRMELTPEVSINYVLVLQRHSEMYGLPPPRYQRSDQPPFWQCEYLGNTVLTMRPTDSKDDVAHVMLTMATVNRPIHP
jgi:hypothetical protein